MLLANPERRLIDTRQGGKPATLLAVATGLDPNVVRAVVVNITVVPQGAAGYCSINGVTSFNNFPQAEPRDAEKTLKLNADGTVSLGASTPVHWIVDLVGEYH